MKRLLLPVLALSALLVGCKPASLAGTYNCDVGTLTLADGGEFTLAPKAGGNTGIKGKWKEETDKVVLTPETFGGKPTSEVLSQLDTLGKALGKKAGNLEEVKAMIKEMDLPVDKDRKVLTLTVQGKSFAFTKSAG